MNLEPLTSEEPSAAARRRLQCRHCGAPLTDTRMQERGFCCSGCAYVHRLVHEHGLEGYYRLKDDVTVPADPAVFQLRDYAWLQSAQDAAEAAVREGAAQSRRGVPVLQLDLQGISCVGCVWLIERLFQQMPGARDIIVNAQLGTMRLRWIPGEFSAVDFARKLQAFGYLAGPTGTEKGEGEGRGLVRRIGLCAAFALNVMLFTLPGYFGMERTFAYAGLFELLALVLATLSLLVGGSYFLGRAVHALREGALHLDLPIALGIVGAYGGSLYGWLVGDARFMYFDFVAVFILLMLIGRWAQVSVVERNQRRLLRLQPQLAPLVGRSGEVIAPDSLVAGREFSVATGQVLPVKAEMAGSESADFSLASINGEAEPRCFRPGQTVPAGAVNLSRSPVWLESRESWTESLMAQLLESGDRPGWRHRLLERIVQGYLIGILAVAILAGLGWAWFGGDPVRAWSVVTAVLVVSCPCAIGLAFPLADEMATVAFRRRGGFVREGDLWSKVHRIRRVVFDKTGTLTLETPVLRNPEALRELSPEARRVLRRLVEDNPHPVAQSLLENLLAESGEGGESDLNGRGEANPGILETAGQGVRWGDWSLGRPGWATGRGQPGDETGDVELACAARVIACFQFTDVVRAQAAAEIAGLRSLGLQVNILSGDRMEKVSRLARELGLPESEALGELSPLDKARWLEAHDADEALMLGDGLNDSLAFDRALCRGTPVVHRGVLEQKADFYYLGRGIDGIRALFRIDAVRRRTQWMILAFSIAYNVAAVGLAVAGLMSPLLAAVLMPLNSLLTLAIVAGGMKSAFSRDPAAHHSRIDADLAAEAGLRRPIWPAT